MHSGSTKTSPIRKCFGKALPVQLLTPRVLQINAAARAHAPAANPICVQNQLSIDRSPSAIEFQVAALSRQLSSNSNASSPSQQSTFAARASLQEQAICSEARAHCRSGSATSINTIREIHTYIRVDGTVCGPGVSSLKPNISVRSVGSAKSAKSIQAIGSLEFGSLRLHTISPKPVEHMETHDALLAGDIVIVRDVPLGTIFGYDARSFIISAKGKFEGIKHLPVGAHFVWGGSAVGSLRTGCWLMSPVKGSVEYGQRIVKRWDAHEEMLVEYVVRSFPHTILLFLG